MTESFPQIHANGDKSWINATGQIHRLVEPAVITADGTKMWFHNNERHRTTGPAIEYSDGQNSWYINGECITSKVMQWLMENDAVWPFNKELETLFIMTFAP